jgi:outer membrane receptor protein involved in Fe transport
VLLYVDRQNQGWEFEFAAQVTREFEIVGNFTRMRMREENGLPPLMVPDKAGGLFAKYTLREGRFQGLGVSFGLHYTGVQAGETATGLTAAGVPVQPSFYVASRTVSQAGISYRRERWSLGVVVNNLTDKDYIQSANGRDFMLPSEPRNVSATLVLRW